MIENKTEEMRIITEIIIQEDSEKRIRKSMSI